MIILATPRRFVAFHYLRQGREATRLLRALLQVIPTYFVTCQFCHSKSCDIGLLICSTFKAAGGPRRVILCLAENRMKSARYEKPSIRETRHKPRHNELRVR
jgi:hypothetical protein